MDVRWEREWERIEFDSAEGGDRGLCLGPFVFGAATLWGGEGAADAE